MVPPASPVKVRATKVVCTEAARAPRSQAPVRQRSLAILHFVIYAHDTVIVVHRLTGRYWWQHLRRGAFRVVASEWRPNLGPTSCREGGSENGHK